MGNDINIDSLLPLTYEPPVASGGIEPRGGKCTPGNGPPGSDCDWGFLPTSGKCSNGDCPTGSGCEEGIFPL